jgi:hypothetical protein
MDITRLAGDKLSTMLPLQQSNEGGDRIMLQSFQVVLGDITRALVDAANISNRVHAAKVLDYFCDKYTKNDEYLKELKKSMVHVMPKVIFCFFNSSTLEFLTDALLSYLFTDHIWPHRASLACHCR